MNYSEFLKKTIAEQTFRFKSNGYEFKLYIKEEDIEFKDKPELDEAWTRVEVKYIVFRNVYIEIPEDDFFRLSKAAQKLILLMNDRHMKYLCCQEIFDFLKVYSIGDNYKSFEVNNIIYQKKGEKFYDSTTDGGIY